MKKRFIIFPLVAAVTVLAMTGCGAGAVQSCNKGMEYYNSHNYTEAASCFQEAVNKSSENTDYRIYLGMTQIELEDYDAAMETFDAAIAIDAECRDAYRGKGIVFYKEGNYAEALTQLKKAIDMSQNKYDDIHVDSLRYYASSLLITCDYANAAEAYTLLLDKANQKEKAELYYCRGTAYVFLREENKAVLDYEESIKICDDNYVTYCNMYSNFMEAGYADRAESYLKRLLNGESEDKDKLLFGRTYFILGDYEKAKEYLETAYSDGEGDAAYYLAMTYEKLQNYAEADRLYQEYLGKHPNDAHIYNQYGAYLINRGNYDGALAYIETGIEYDNPKVMQELYFNRAVCYEYKHNYAKAFEYFSEYVKKYPNDKAAQREYEFLKTRQ